MPGASFELSQRTARFGAATLFGAVLLLAACGGSSAPDTAAQAGPTAVEATAAEVAPPGDQTPQNADDSTPAASATVDESVEVEEPGAAELFDETSPLGALKNRVAGNIAGAGEEGAGSTDFFCFASNETTVAVGDDGPTGPAEAALDVAFDGTVNAWVSQTSDVGDIVIFGSGKGDIDGQFPMAMTYEIGGQGDLPPIEATITDMSLTIGPAMLDLTPCEALSRAPYSTIETDLDWLRVDGLGSAEFGDPAGQVRAAVEAQFGPPIAVVEQPECPGGPATIVDYDEFTLLFMEDSFDGWFYQSSNPNLTTPSGVAPGIGRSELESIYQGVQIDPNSTLGEEFFFEVPSGYIGGFIEADAVTALYAGTTCFFR